MESLGYIILAIVVIIIICCFFKAVSPCEGYSAEAECKHDKLQNNCWLIVFGGLLLLSIFFK
ncbi:MAG: hypothetical protein RRZ68_06200 [Oscillospiraceae bacterium]